MGVPWDPLPRLWLQLPRGSGLQQLLGDSCQSQACPPETLGAPEGPLGADGQAEELPEILGHFTRVGKSEQELNSRNDGTLVRKCPCSPMGSPGDGCRMCRNSKRRTIALPLSWHCQHSLPWAVHFLSLSFHLFPPVLPEVPVAEVTFPQPGCTEAPASALCISLPCTLVTQTPLNNPLGALSSREFKACLCFSGWSNSAFSQHFICVYWIFSFVSETFLAWLCLGEGEPS